MPKNFKIQIMALIKNVLIWSLKSVQSNMAAKAISILI